MVSCEAKSNAIQATLLISFGVCAKAIIKPIILMSELNSKVVNLINMNGCDIILIRLHTFKFLSYMNSQS